MAKHKVIQMSVSKRFPLENANVKGFMNEEDSFFLYASVLFSRPESILEIGHYLGKSTAAICQAIRDAKIKTRFDSFDLPYETTEAFEDYYKSIHQQEVHASVNLFPSGKNFTQSAKRNLEDLDLVSYVNLTASDFRESKFNSYDLIFADVLHDSSEITLNLPDILKLGTPKTLYLFDDMRQENIEQVERQSQLRLIRKTGKVGAFKDISQLFGADQ
jgi:predicted O-methyltransferase YrrM